MIRRRTWGPENVSLLEMDPSGISDTVHKTERSTLYALFSIVHAVPISFFLRPFVVYARIYKHDLLRRTDSGAKRSARARTIRRTLSKLPRTDIIGDRTHRQQCRGTFVYSA